MSCLPDQDQAPVAAPPVSPKAFWVRSFVRLSRDLEGRPFPSAGDFGANRAAGAKVRDALAAAVGPLREVARDAVRPGLDRAWLALESGFSGEPLIPGLKPDAVQPGARLLLPRTARAPAGGIPRFNAVVNSRNHLVLCGNAPGNALLPLWREVSAVDDKLAARLPYAFTPETGYLLADAAHIGNGLHAACLLHLPATRILSLGAPLVALLDEAGYELSFWARLDAEPENPPGALCLLSPKHAGKDDEESVIARLSAVAAHVCEREAATLERLRRLAPDILLDIASRAVALAGAAVRADPFETFDLLSDLRLAAVLGHPGIPSVRSFYAAALRAQPLPVGADSFAPGTKLRLASLLRSVAAKAAPPPRKVAP